MEAWGSSNQRVVLIFTICTRLLMGQERELNSKRLMRAREDWVEERRDGGRRRGSEASCAQSVCLSRVSKGPDRQGGNGSRQRSAGRGAIARGNEVALF